MKFIQAIFIGWDSTIYDESKDMPTKAQSSNLNEELGKIEYIFSDKTGTLTQNIMEFKKMCIGGISYGKDKRDEEEKMERAQGSQDPDISNVDFYDPEFFQHARNEQHENYEMIDRFMMHLALCHTIIIDKKEVDGKERVTYNAR